MRNRKIKEIVLKISSGLIASLTDLTLYLIFLSLTSIGKTGGSRGVYQAFLESDRLLEQVNYKTIIRALQNLRNKRLIKPVYRKRIYELEITTQGLRRINSLLPQYDTKRLWDKRIYTITYDIAVKHNKYRNLLRQYLRRIGAAPLQESVYLTPYNPKQILREFIRQYKIIGTIIVADLGSDGSIGDEDLKSLIRRIYQLDNLNSRYKDFIKKYTGESNLSRYGLIFDFYTILKDDPQLPFSLLPADWTGTKAHEIFSKYISLDKQRHNILTRAT